MKFSILYFYTLSLSLYSCNMVFAQSKPIPFSKMNTPIIVAHRGASKDAPENTLPAFRLGWVQGADAIEGDFHLTKDKQIVCIHDPDTKKITGKKLIVKESTLTELKQLDMGAYHGEKFIGTTIPTIAEVFKTVPKGKKFYIEIKSDAEIIPYLLKEIKKSGLIEEQIVIISFNHQVLKEFKSTAPQFKVYWLSSFKRNERDSFTPSVDTVLNTLKYINADGFSSTKKRIDLDFITTVKEAGYEYHVWTVNNEETAKRFQQWGTQSITTDTPSKIKNSLSR